MDCAEICDRFDERLRVEDYADVDASENGLQVGPTDREVEHVAVAVDAAIETIDRARDVDADLLVVHHGLFWGDGLNRVTGESYRRLAPLFEGDLPLYAAHLPLDGHQDLGNAAGVADVLDLSNRAPFGELGGEYVGQRGRMPATTVESLRERLTAELDTDDAPVQTLDFGPAEITDVAVVTGSGTDWIEEAARKGMDALVTGEGKQQAYHRAKELGITVVLAGHYATETFGVGALAGLAEEWDLETTFLDCPTGL
ncbi:Nif3-like dinuclear metal center hexameric protein [Halorhabdus amylolytica]|uniref:Nif3-like dinuclear metal center hexameric protein n=1 Tax=Halorhabdus amylolytica TaxID=2559573 RepID=UPI0010AA5B42|nr:Nif3-like dinuclear metal center hexameric protein [Halorhabdus amylolytica]